MEEDKNLEQNLDKSNEKLHISDVSHTLSKTDIERQIKGYIGLQNMARNHGENETVEKFDKLINDLKLELEKLNCG